MNRRSKYSSSHISSSNQGIYRITGSTLEQIVYHIPNSEQDKVSTFQIYVHTYIYNQNYSLRLLYASYAKANELFRYDTAFLLYSQYFVLRGYIDFMQNATQFLAVNSLRYNITRKPRLFHPSNTSTARFIKAININIAYICTYRYNHSTFCCVL